MDSRLVNILRVNMLETGKTKSHICIIAHFTQNVNAYLPNSHPNKIFSFVPYRKNPPFKAGFRLTT